MGFLQNRRLVKDFKSGKLWSLEWIKENQVTVEFDYVIVKKHPSGYLILGEFSTATEAFNARRQYVSETGDTKVFIKATPKAFAVAECGDEDLLRDCARDGTEPPEHMRPAFDAYLAKRRNVRKYSSF